MSGERWQPWEDAIIAAKTCKEAEYLLVHRTAEAISSRRQILGVGRRMGKPTRRWSDTDCEILRQANGDYALLTKLLPDRSRKALGARSRILGILVRPTADWRPTEVRRLCEIYPTATKAELLAAFPNRTFRSLSLMATRMGANRAPKTVCGIYAIDEVIERARALGMSKRNIEQALQIGGALNATLSRRCGVPWASIGRAVELLRGELYAEWED